MAEILHSILSDPVFSVQEKEWILKFNEEVTRRVQAQGLNFGITMFSITDAINLDLTRVHKEGPFMFALWVVLLCHFKAHLTLADMKYQTLEQFAEVYQGWFQEESETEIYHLWQIANWMNILFKMITARKNKGLAMQVIPKIIEGWEVKYVTGSGQTRFTANRVHVFEVEGNTKANHRSKFKSGKRTGQGRRMSQSSTREIAGMMPKKRRRPKKKVQDDTSSEEMQYVYNFHDHDSTDMDEDDSHDSHGEEEEGENLNPDVKKVYDFFANQRYQRDDSNYSDMDLVRDISNMYFDSDPIPMKRDVSWKEIEVEVPPAYAAPEFNLNNMNVVYTPNPNEMQNSPAVLPSRTVNDIFFGYHM
jgi:hypothetical protein